MVRVCNRRDGENFLFDKILLLWGMGRSTAPLGYETGWVRMIEHINTLLVNLLDPSPGQFRRSGVTTCTCIYL